MFLPGLIAVLGIWSGSVIPARADIADWLTPIGCFRDKPNHRALPKLIRNFRNTAGLWSRFPDFSHVINQCGAMALSAGHTIFGVEYYGECWTTETPESLASFDKNGPSKKCKNGVGRSWNIMVYSINKEISQCGVDQTRQRIIGGSASAPGKWPWHVGIYFNDTYTCGGSIINPNWILTAGHCIFSDDPQDAGDYAGWYKVRVGDYDRQVPDEGETVHQADVIIRNKDFQFPQPDGDIGLIHLQFPIIYSDYAKPVCLPDVGEQRPLGKTCYVTGWGKTGQEEPKSRYLKEGLMPTVTMDECAKKTENTTDPWLSVAKLTDKMLCGGIEGSELSGCNGDSGGPYVCKADDGHWVQQGVVSWGSRFCDSRESFSVFTRVSMLKEWIDSTIQEF